MGCFCHASVAPLGNLLGQLRASGLASVQAGVPAPALRGANIASALAGWLSQHGLPAAPWTPDPAWLNTPLPQVPLSLHQVATISALAQLQAQVQSQLGINLMQPAGVHAFARVIATLQTRLAAIAALPGMTGFSAAPLLRLAASMNAIAQVQAALQAGVFAPSPAQLTAFSMPGGLPIARWGSFLAQLRKLAAMIAAAAHLNVSLSDTTALSAAVRALARVQLPTIPPAQAQLMAQLTAALSAQASLHTTLGIAPGSMSLPQLTAMVQARLNAMLTAVAQAFGMSLRGLTPEAALAALMGMLPKMPPAPTLLAPPAVVSAAFNAHALASLNWNVPPILPSTQIGLPACAFAAQLAKNLQVTPVLPSPCGSGCDAARVMRAAAQAVGV